MTDRPGADPTPSWGDWRTDTAARGTPLVPGRPVAAPEQPAPSAPPDDRTRTLPAVRTEDAPAVDLPRSARWPLYADARDEVADGAPSRRHPAGAWAAAAIVLVLASGAGGLWFADATEPAAPSTVSIADPGLFVPPKDPQDDTAAARPAGSSRDAERPTGAGGPDDVGGREADARRRARSVIGLADASAAETAPPNVGLAGERVTYDAANLLDAAPETAWRMPGDGSDSVLTLRLEQPTEITSVGLVNGYTKTAGGGQGQVDWYLANRRVRQVQWFFDDGSRVVQSLGPTRRMQRTDIRPVVTSTIRLRLSEVSPPGPGPAGRDYTAISEIGLRGVPRAGR